ncbi:hypothetical protein ABNQ24_12785 [Ralstonia pseudosolanacearum]|uniref:hypothetical protein n=1 Tax=Ralstonia pseudosolanacearum TaxID=1310165 RepID=UPI003369CE45
MEDNKSTQAMRLFSQLSGQTLDWTPDLQKLATVYMGYLEEAQKADHPIMVGHYSAMAVALANFAADARWLAAGAAAQLRENATDVRDEVLQQWRGEVINITVCTPEERAATATRH